MEVDQFLEQFRSSLNAVMALGSESIILMGDFNDWCTIWDLSHDLSDLKK